MRTLVVLGNVKALAFSRLAHVHLSRSTLRAIVPLLDWSDGVPCVSRVLDGV
jgi:hypothetical protein